MSISLRIAIFEQSKATKILKPIEFAKAFKIQSNLAIVEPALLRYVPIL